MAKGFLDGLLHDMSIAAAVQASKDKNGKPNVYKATGLAAGMGHTSFKDLTKLGAALASQGAFDETPSGSGHGSSWRRRHEDECFDYGLDPDFYDTEEELEAALDEARWHEEYRDECKEYDLDIDDYDSEGEVVEALNTAKWRKKHEKECDKYDVDPYWYDTEEELVKAIENEKTRRLNSFRDAVDKHNERVKKLLGLNKKFVALRYVLIIRIECGRILLI